MNNSGTYRISSRIIIAVMAGILTTFVLSAATDFIMSIMGLHPPLLKPMYDDAQAQMTLMYHSMYAVAGAFVTAMIAKKHSRKAVLILGAKELVIWLIVTFILYDQAPTWYTTLKALLGIPLAMLGGRLYETYHKRQVLQAAKSLG
jgi:hypothetical protein